MPDIKASDAMRGAALYITVHCRQDLRFRLGLWLVRLGVRLMGANPVILDKDLES